MTAVVWWKEYRQQRWIWATILGLGLMLIVAVAEAIGRGTFWQVFHEGDVQSALWTTVICLGLAYGVVCGALLLAGEKEDGTLAFLEGLSARRGPVWQAKLSVGVLLTLALAIVLSALGRSLGFLSWRWAVLVPCLSLDALVWGMLGGALCRKVFPAVLAGTFFLAVTLLVPLLFDVGWTFLLAKTGMAVVGGYVSWKVYSAEDQTRIEMEKPRKDRPVSSWRVVAWMVVRQGRWVLACCLVGCVAVGFVLNLAPLIIWPVAAWLVGLTCGLAVFAPEQASGQHFWGNQRIPWGRVWGMKLLFWGAAAILGTAVLWGIAFILRDVQLPQRAMSEGNWFVRWQGPLAMNLDAMVFLSLWVLYSFAFGQLFGLLCPRFIIAVILAAVISAAFVLGWAPSAYTGGLQTGQLFPVPLLLLLATRLAMRPWVSGRLYTAPPLLVTATLGVLSVAWLAGSLWYRVVEVPDVGEPFDVQAYRASLDQHARNEAGKLIRQAITEVKHDLKKVESRLGPPTWPIFAAEYHLNYSNFLIEIVDKGWPKKDGEMARFMDQVFEGSWAKLISPLADLPLALLEDPRTTSLHNIPWSMFHDARTVGTLLIARAYQLQARGDYEQALEKWAMTLALSNQLRYQGHGQQASEFLDQHAFQGWASWLAGVGPNVKILLKARKRLKEYEDHFPDYADALKAEYLEFMNSWASLPRETLGSHEGRKLEGDFIAILKGARWEKDRTKRILNAVFLAQKERLSRPYWETRARQVTSNQTVDDDRFSHIARMHGLPPDEGPGADLPAGKWGQLILESLWGNGDVWYGRNLLFWRTASENRLRATLLVTSLALYQAENGQLPSTLQALVPRYLKELPTDPYLGGPYQYRISKGEEIAGVFIPYKEINFTKQKLLKGQGLVWSRAPDPLGHKIGYYPVPVWKQEDKP